MLMADYHHWAYQQLFEVVDCLSDEQYFKELGLFFKSIHGTLNHLLLADSLWLARYQGKPFPVKSLDQELESDRKMLREALFKTATHWKVFLSQLDEAHLPQDLVYTDTSGTERSRNYQQCLIHVFNHATHHRGQISAVLTQLGEQAPVMDLAYLPHVKDK